MNINKPNHKKRNIIITFAVVLLLGIAAYSAVAYARGYWPFLLASNTQDTKDTESKIDYKTAGQSDGDRNQTTHQDQYVCSHIVSQSEWV